MAKHGGILERQGSLGGFASGRARSARHLFLPAFLWAPVLLVAALWPREVGAARTLKVPDEYFTIQEALDAAKPGDRVEVANGTYRQTVALRSGVTLESVGGRDSCLILAPLQGVMCIVSADSLADKATIRGFTLDGRDGVNVVARQGVRVAASEVDILDNRFEGMNTAIALEGCPRGLIARNEIRYTRSTGVFVKDSSPLLVGNDIRYASNYGISIFGRASAPVIGGSRGRANRIVSFKGSIDVGNGGPNRIDARYNDWGQSTTVELNTKGYPANITTFEDAQDDPKSGMIDYRHWVGQPLLASLLSEPSRLALPVLLALAVVVGAAIRLSLRRRRPTA